ncbi:hypothetical protein J5751_02000 [bacterium]|nr:hypothetical protein [bacterium]
MPIKTLLIMIVTQVIFKVLYETIILPITILIIKKAEKYENFNYKQLQ